jgi:exodeoxyribonuclease VII large subunit
MPVSESIETASKPGKSPEEAISVQTLSQMMGAHISRLGQVWVEGEVLSAKLYGQMYFISFRDLENEIGIEVVAGTSVVDKLPEPLDKGSKVLLHVSTEWWTKRGEVKFRVREIRPLGLGELLVRIEMLRNALRAEGLFDLERKKPLPFLPRKVGLITGRDTDALKDVVVNARRRWPATQFEIREIPLQQPDTPLLTISALNELQAIAEVDVIVIARGGGSFADLLPWSDEGLAREVAKAYKPIVSAIGHEADRPILDDVADVRASTPTDAASKIVPSLEEERALFDRNVGYLKSHRIDWLASENRHLELVRTALTTKSPKALLQNRLVEVRGISREISLKVKHRIEKQVVELSSRKNSLAALSPFNVLARGYSVLYDESDNVIKSTKDVSIGQNFKAQVSDGTIEAERKK